MLLPVAHTDILKYKNGEISPESDLLAVEEPLEIRIGFGKPQERQQMSLVTTMRTPTGHDFELVIGFLFSENIISQYSDIQSIKYCTDTGKQSENNIIRVELMPEIDFQINAHERFFMANSSCGVCGKASIEQLEKRCHSILNHENITFDGNKLLVFSQKIIEHQKIFQFTGGLHAAALFDLEGNLLLLREDVGRHNACDKLIGATILSKIDFSDKILFMTSRASFELVQKAVIAGIPIMVSVGSATNLAVNTAKQYNLTLVSFVKNDSFNIHTANQRIKFE
jgi:FdhD protein